MFTVKEDAALQRLHYDATAGAYLHLDEPRQLDRASLAMILPEDVAVLVRCFYSSHTLIRPSTLCSASTEESEKPVREGMC